jgi:hypothetical protein
LNLALGLRAIAAPAADPRPQCWPDAGRRPREASPLAPLKSTIALAAMASHPDKPARKRIVPQQIISPQKEAAPDAGPSEAELAALEARDLSEEAAAGAALGPGRRVRVALEGLAAGETALVDWRKVLRARGLRRDGRAIGAPAGGGAADGAQGAGGPPAEGAPAPTALARVIQRLERAVGMAAVRPDGEASSSESEDDGGAAGAAPRGAAAGAAPRGAATGASDSEGEGVAKDAAEGGAAGKDGLAERGNEYDYRDEWIDDSEVIDRLEGGDRRAARHAGFFITRGALERAEADEAGGARAEAGGGGARKRRAGEGSGDDFERVPKKAAGGAGGAVKRKASGAEGEAPAPKKRSKKVAAAAAAAADGAAPARPLSIAQRAAAAGAGAGAGTGASGASPPVPAKPLAPPYHMPADAAAAIVRVLAAAAAAPAPEPGARRALPAPVLDALRAEEPLFRREVEAHRPRGLRAVLDALAPALEQWTTRVNLRAHVGGKPPKPPPQPQQPAAPPAAPKPPPPQPPPPQPPPPPPPPPPANLEELCALLAAIPPPPAAAPSAEGAAEGAPATEGAEGTEGAAGAAGVESAAAAPAAPVEAGKLWKRVPPAARRQVHAWVRARAVGAELNSGAGRAVLEETLAQFPAGTMDLPSLRTLCSRERAREAKVTARAGGSRPPSATGTPAPGARALSVAAVAAAAGAAAAAAGGLTPEHIRAALDSQRPASAQPAAAPPARLPAPPATAPAPASIEAVAAPPAAPPAAVAPAAAAPRMSDNDIVAAGVALGAPAPALRAALAAADGGHASAVYPGVLARVLVLAGAKGASVAEAAATALERGLAPAAWDAGSQTVRNGLVRSTKVESVAHIGGYRYALRCFPGVVEKPRKPKAAKGGAGGAAGEGEGAAPPADSPAAAAAATTAEGSPTRMPLAAAAPDADVRLPLPTA